MSMQSTPPERNEQLARVASTFNVTIDTLKLWRDRGAPVPEDDEADLTELRKWIARHVLFVEPEAAFPQELLNTGFRCGLIIAVSVLAATVVYLMLFQGIATYGLASLRDGQGTDGVDETTIQLAMLGRLMLVKMTLLSCGVFVGLAMIGLGFSLFLIGVRGELDLVARKEGFLIKISRLAPGLFVLLCAAVLIAICVTYQFSISGAELASTQPASNSDTDEADEDAQPDSVSFARVFTALFAGEAKTTFGKFAGEVKNVLSSEIQDPAARMNELSTAARYLAGVYDGAAAQLEAERKRAAKEGVKEDELKQIDKELGEHRKIVEILRTLENQRFDDAAAAKQAARDFGDQAAKLDSEQ